MLSYMSRRLSGLIFKYPSKYNTSVMKEKIIMFVLREGYFDHARSLSIFACLLLIVISAQTVG